MLQYVTLGNTGICVSRICFGSLTVSELGAGLPIEEGAHVIAHALERGINFIDTAQYYDNYEVICEGISLMRSRSPSMPEPVICSKTYAWNRELAVEAVEDARRRLDRDVIDIFMLHEQESIHTLRGHMEALEYLYQCRDKGIVRAVGLSTHCVDAVTAARQIRHSHGTGLDVVFPMFNMSGLGIKPAKDGAAYNITDEAERRLAARDEMYSEIKLCHDSGIGVMLMKIFGGGHLLGEVAQDKTAFDSPSARAARSLSFAIDCSAADSIAIGMQSEDEVDENIRFITEGCFSNDFRAKTDKRRRRLVVEDYCEGCGRCVKRCGQGAMRIEDGAAVCDADKCVLCGYCAGVCPQFAIKVI